MSLEAVTTDLITFMRNYISDPTGENRTWIFPTMPKVTANFPEITLTNVGSKCAEIGLGNSGQRYTYLFEVDVWVKRDNQVDIIKMVNGVPVTTVYAGRRLLEYISDAVTNAFLDNKNVLLDSYKFIDAELYNHFSLPYEEEIDCFRKSIQLKVIRNRK